MNIFRSIAKSFGGFLEKIGKDIREWGEKKKEKPLPPPPPTKWFNVEMYVTKVRSGEHHTPEDAGYILFNVKEKEIPKAKDFMRKIDTFRIKDLLNIPKNHIVYEIHHGISESNYKYYFKDINGKITRHESLESMTGGF